MTGKRITMDEAIVRAFVPNTSIILTNNYHRVCIVNGTVDPPVPIPIEYSDTITITNPVSPISANTEFSHTLVANVKSIMIRVRGTAKLQYSFVATESGTKFITIFPGSVRKIDGIDIASGTIYMQVNKASQIIEIEELS